MPNLEVNEYLMKLQNVLHLFNMLSHTNSIVKQLFDLYTIQYDNCTNVRL
jgi:hypothetical protein